jgi:hypothetical protein
MTTMRKFAVGVVLLLGVSAGCSAREKADPESAMPTVPTEVEEYRFDDTLQGRVGRDVRVTGYVHFEGGKGIPHLDRDQSGERGVLVSHAEAYLNRYVEIVGTVVQVPPPATAQPFGMGEQRLGAGTLYIVVRHIKEIPKPAD